MKRTQIFEKSYAHVPRRSTLDHEHQKLLWDRQHQVGKEDVAKAHTTFWSEVAQAMQEAVWFKIV